jgi:uncharacterized protein YodC (DUF2158 family)
VRLADSARRALTEVVSVRPANKLLFMDDDTLEHPPGPDAAAATSIKVGDVVRLKAGGAPMNVRSISDTRVMCTWFDLEGQRKIDVFDLDGIELLHDLSGLQVPPHRE